MRFPASLGGLQDTDFAVVSQPAGASAVLQPDSRLHCTPEVRSGSIYGITAVHTWRLLIPSRASDATTPLPTGSAASANTIGIVEVACFAATSALPTVTMTSTLSRTNSAAVSANRSRPFSGLRQLLDVTSVCVGLGCPIGAQEHAAQAARGTSSRSDFCILYHFGLYFFIERDPSFSQLWSKSGTKLLFQTPYQCVTKRSKL
jgi:hypothetical protein